MPDREQARAFLERQALDDRQRAEQFRTVAEGTRNPEARRALLRLATEADKMAARIEARVAALRRGRAMGIETDASRPRASDRRDRAAPPEQAGKAAQDSRTRDA
jgi:hypothetical protein